MLKKQDRTPVRNAPEVERKYNLTQLEGANQNVFAAQRSAAQAEQAVKNLIKSLDQEYVVSYLTNSGAAPAIYLIDGQLYINASYIKQGVIKSADGKSIVIDLDNNTATFANINTAISEMENRLYDYVNDEMEKLWQELQNLGVVSL